MDVRQPVDVLAEALDAEARDRGRLGALLHEYALQSLLLAQQELDEGNADVAGRALQVGITQLRETIAELHPVAYEHAGLYVAIESVAREAAERRGLEVRIEVSAEVPADQQMLVLALVRGLVGNVERHAGARRMRVELGHTDGHTELVVADDGRGFSPAGESSGRGAVGLASIEQRVRAFGGTLEVISADGIGTSVTARIPATL